MNKPTTYLWIVLLSILLFTHETKAQGAAELTHYYLLEFETIEQQQVKPLIALLMPIFKEVPHLEQDTYEVFYYQTKEEVDLSAVEALIQSQSSTIVRFESMGKKAYTKVIND